METRPEQVRNDSLEDFMDKLKRLDPKRVKNPTIYFTIEGSQQDAGEQGKTLRAFMTFSAIADTTEYTCPNILAVGIAKTEDEMKGFNETVQKNRDAFLDKIKKECANWKIEPGMTNFLR